MQYFARFRFWLPILLGFALAACGTTAYQKPIQTFSDATALTQKSLHDYADALVRQVRENRIKEAVDKPAGVRFEGDDCLSDSSRCRIVFLRSKDDPSPRLLSLQQPIPKILALMDAIKNYADGLQAIATSDSGAKAEASLAAVGGSLQNLTALLGEPGKALSGFTEPAGEAIGWIAGAYIDSVRLDALRIATKDADPLIAKAVPIFEAAAKEVDIANRAALAETVSERNDEFRRTPSESNLNALLSAAAAFDAVATAAPDEVFRKLASSHAELTKALNNPEINLASAFAAMDALKTEAEKLQKIVSAFIVAAQSNG